MMTRKLPVDLSMEEMVSKSRALAAKMAERDEKEDAGKEAASVLRKLLKNMDGDIKKAAKMIVDGTEDRMVDVMLRPNPQRTTIELIRLDTGVVVESRPMNADEREAHRQGTLQALLDGRKPDPLGDDEADDEAEAEETVQ